MLWSDRNLVNLLMLLMILWLSEKTFKNSRNLSKLEQFFLNDPLIRNIGGKRLSNLNYFQKSVKETPIKTSSYSIIVNINFFSLSVYHKSICKSVRLWWAKWEYNFLIKVIFYFIKQCGVSDKLQADLSPK
jgi:hypothetical protein